MDYGGDRESVQSFLDFLTEHSTVKFEVSRVKKDSANGSSSFAECDQTGMCLTTAAKLAIDKSEL